MIRRWEAEIVRSGTVPFELADAIQLLTLAEAGLVTMSLSDYDDLPADLQQRLDVVLGARMKKRALDRQTTQAQMQAAGRRSIR